MTWEIRSATSTDVPQLARALARAFATEPGVSWMLPDEVSRPRRLALMFSTILQRLYLPLRATEVAVRDVDVAAGAIWCPPQTWKPPWWRAAQSGPGMVRALGGRLRAGQTMMQTLEDHHPTEPHWYLAVLGTDPAAQGQGAGVALLDARLGRCDASSEAAYLETADEANLGYYERFGFEVIQQIEFPNGAPPQWGMWRNPDRDIRHDRPSDSQDSERRMGT